MINYIRGNILSQKNGVIIHGTNCSGGFGSGVAGAIRATYPIVYEKFKTLEPSESLLGTIQAVEITPDLTIINCFTQHKFGSDGKVYASKAAVAGSVCAAYVYAKDNGIDILSMPKIGSGLGGLSWDNDVLPIIYTIVDMFPSITTNVYYID